MQRAFRLRRAEHLAALEERIDILEGENQQLRSLLQLPEADRGQIGSGPTGRGKSLVEGGVPMSERVRARKEARENQRKARGLPEPLDSSEMSDRDLRDSVTVSPPKNLPPQLPRSGQPDANAAPFYDLPAPFHVPLSPVFGDFDYKGGPSTATPNFGSMFNLFDNDNAGEPSTRSPISPPLTHPTPTQPDLLTRLKACCQLSDSHVVNDPGLLIFATRLCQSFPCTFAGVHPDPNPTSDGEHLVLEDSWRALKAQLDPGGETDGENRINTGRMAAELVCRAAHSRGQGGWIVCRYREGMSVKRSLIAGLVKGFGGTFE